MRPSRIILLRHGEAEGNIDESLFEHKPDHRMELTARGLAQSRAVGEKLRELVGASRVRVYVSPYLRAWQTLNELHLEDLVDRVVEEPRLREQDWGNFQNGATIVAQKEERNRFGHFFYRLADGESGADVFDRVSSFLETLHRDFRDDDYPDTALLVTHGLMMRLFFMRWFHWTVDYFEALENPGHCEMKILEQAGGRYALDRPFSTWRAPAVSPWPPAR
ncbi:MAG: histidine phosphatase family protein [Polyangiaceae bacterium]